MSTDESANPDDIRRRIRKTIDEIAEAAKSGAAPREFLSAVLTFVVPAMAAVGGAVWLVDEGGKFGLECEINLLKMRLAKNSESELAHARMLARALDCTEGMLVQPQSQAGDEHDHGNPSEFLLVLAPLIANQKSLGVVEIIQRPGGSKNVQRGFLRFLTHICDSAGEYLAKRQ